MVAMFSDAHLHIHEVNGGYPDLADAELLFACTARPDEWDLLAHVDDRRLLRFYGVHPWYASEWNPDTRERLERLLVSDPCAGVGEIGLDRVRGAEGQEEVFSRQLELASRLGRPVSVHMVGMEKEVSDLVAGKAGGVPVIIHGFSAESYSRRLVEAGCYLSVGPRLLRKSRDNARRILASIPEDRLLIETDAPHSGADFNGLGDLYARFAELMDTDPAELAAAVTDNMGRIHGR